MSCLPTIEQLARRRVGLLGFGRAGQAAARALQAANSSADVTVLVESGAADTGLPVLRGTFGDELCSLDALIRSPGVPADHPALVAARAAGVAIINPASLWLAERGDDIIVLGITGSKGKSTTASMLAHLLSACGHKTLLAGNIGVPLLDHLNTDADVAVIELSSYQLADLEGRLDMGIMTSLFPEHLDWHGSERAYVDAKLRMAGLLEGRPLLINAGDDRLAAATQGIVGRVCANRAPLARRVDNDVRVDDAVRVDGRELQLVGRHNLDNAALALQAALQLGCDARKLADALKSYRPLPHRLEQVAVINGVRYINDSISTNPWSARAALEALSPAPIILIAGGHARTTCWQPVLEWTENNELAGLIALPDNGHGLANAYMRQRTRRNDHRAYRVHQADQLDDAVELAAGMAPEGSVVLLSPGAPSFGRYRDFEQRGEHFRRAVSALASP